jgi:hypothetical protein
LFQPCFLPSTDQLLPVIELQPGFSESIALYHCLFQIH